jgi:2-polyprenyl-6-methoxyphenol hydroxylase-like FAD-dependent oxidoreductase
MTVDAVVVVGGHNGLVAAAYLARAGWRVRVLERTSVAREVLGRHSWNRASRGQGVAANGNV